MTPMDLPRTTLGSNAEMLVEAIRTRRSFALKQLAPDPIDLDLIAVMLEAANWAPNHGQTEPWRFTIFAGDGRQQLSDAFGAGYLQLTAEAGYDAGAERGQRDRV